MHFPDHLVAVMNDTKWDELRLAMYELEPSPSYRTKCWENGYISPWDSEWFYHFCECGYAMIEWVEIRIELENQKQKVLSALSKVHVPTEETPLGFRVYGYIKAGQSIHYF
jgi:hypothetical protein